MVVAPMIMIVNTTIILETMIPVNRDITSRFTSGIETAPYLTGKVIPPKLRDKTVVLLEDGIRIGGSGCSQNETNAFVAFVVIIVVCLDGTIITLWKTMMKHSSFISNQLETP